jgi:hypothetical protein
MTPDVLVGLLAGPARMRVFAAVVLGAGTREEVADRTGLTPRQVAVALSRLRDGGLVAAERDRLVARLEVFTEAMKEYARTLAAPAQAGPLDTTPARAAVLRAFLADGRLVSIPAARGKRRVVLEHIAAVFEPGIRYPEREVNAVLRAWHPDHAALRRYLVDEELMAREGGVYWRIGGPVDIPAP